MHPERRLHPSLAGKCGEGPPFAPPKWRWQVGQRTKLTNTEVKYFTSPETGRICSSKADLEEYLKTLDGDHRFHPSQFHWSVLEVGQNPETAERVESVLGVDCPVVKENHENQPAKVFSPLTVTPKSNFFKSALTQQLSLAGAAEVDDKSNAMFLYTQMQEASSDFNILRESQNDRAQEPPIKSPQFFPSENPWSSASSGERADGDSISKKSLSMDSVSSDGIAGKLTRNLLMAPALESNGLPPRATLKESVRDIITKIEKAKGEVLRVRKVIFPITGNSREPMLAVKYRALNELSGSSLEALNKMNEILRELIEDETIKWEDQLGSGDHLSSSGDATIHGEGIGEA